MYFEQLPHQGGASHYRKSHLGEGYGGKEARRTARQKYCGLLTVALKCSSRTNISTDSVWCRSMVTPKGRKLFTMWTPMMRKMKSLNQTQN